MSTERITLFLCVLLLISSFVHIEARAAELGSITVCEGVVDPELKPVDPTDIFAPDAPAINALVEVKDGRPGAKVTGAWISVDAISVPNYEIKRTEFELKGEGASKVNFELSKPTNGWPKGHYRVDIYIDGEKAGSASFSIQ